MKLLIAFLTNLILLFTSCTNNKPEEQKLQKQVIDKHDVLMARMDLLEDNQLKLNSIILKLKQLKFQNPSLDTTILKQDIDSTKTALIIADEAMMNWMHNFNPDYTGKSHQQVIDYLKYQELKIDSVKTLFDHSLYQSGIIISKY